MHAAAQPSSLLDRLPPVRGRLTASVPLAPLTWFRVGGMAECLFKPADFDDLAQFLANCPADIPVTILGAASNVLIRDGGIPGVVIKLAGGFNQHEVDVTYIYAGAACLDSTISELAAINNLTGLEFLSGIPGTIGGALRMNAGCYKQEMKDVVYGVTALDRQGKKHMISVEDMGFGYRHCNIPKDWIFTNVIFNGKPATAREIAKRMAQIHEERTTSQPTRARTGGSTFRNPPEKKAWELIDAAGCRGLTIGGAQISEKHCNFMLNLGDATAADLETLGDTVRARVLAHSGIDLHWEIERMGEIERLGEVLPKEKGES